MRYSLLISTSELVAKWVKNNALYGVWSCDHTYQTSTEDCPLLMFGILLPSGPFVPVGAIIQNKEDQGAFDFLFTFLRDNCGKEPIAVMGDGAKAMSASLNSIFPDVTRLMCYWHMSRQVRTKLGKQISQLIQLSYPLISLQFGSHHQIME